ncbi:MAG: hypothetical protein WA603_03760 [Candidatus Acidiferrales bacterium]
MLQLEASGLADSSGRASAANLLHYLALRRHDIRELQAQLASLGLSSLGRNEPHVMAGLDAVLKIINQIVAPEQASSDPPNGAPEIGEGATLLEKNAEILLGPLPAGRHVRIMVTMPPRPPPIMNSCAIWSFTAWTACASIAHTTIPKRGPEWCGTFAVP